MKTVFTQSKPVMSRNVQRTMAVVLSAVLAIGSATVMAAPAMAVDSQVLDIDFRNVVLSGSTITNSASSKISDLTVVGSPVQDPTGLTFANTSSSAPSQYLTGNLGATTSMSKIVLEITAKFPDAGCAAQSAGSMVFGLGTGLSSYVPYNIYRHSNFIGFNTFSSEIYGIVLPDNTSFHSYKFVMVPHPTAGNLQEIWVDGVRQQLAFMTSQTAANGCSGLSGTGENPSARIFTNGSYSNGDFMFMTHPLGAATWETTGTLQSVSITTTAEPAPAAPVTPTITTQPANKYVGVDGGATFSVAATRTDSGTLKYQWQSSTNGTTWVNEGGESTSTDLAITNATTTKQYRVGVKNYVGSESSATVTSGVAQLWVSDSTLNAVSWSKATMASGDSNTFYVNGTVSPTIKSFYGCFGDTENGIGADPQPGSSSWAGGTSVFTNNSPAVITKVRKLWFNRDSNGVVINSAPANCSYIASAPADITTTYDLYPATTMAWAPSTLTASVNDASLTPSTGATTNSNGAISYAVNNAGTTNCSVNSATGVVSFTAAGSCVVRASVAAVTLYASTFIDKTFIITSPPLPPTSVIYDPIPVAPVTPILPPDKVSSVQLTPGDKPGQSVITVKLVAPQTAVIKNDIRVRIYDFAGKLVKELTIPVSGSAATVELAIDLPIGDFNVEAASVNSAGFSESVGAVPTIVSRSLFKDVATSAAPSLSGSVISKPILFASNSATLSKEAKSSLRALVQNLANSNARLALTGFTARWVKGRTVEVRLAAKRSLAVAEFLKAQGLTNWIYYAGYGSVVGSESKASARKVELRILR